MVVSCEAVWREISNYLEDDMDPGLRSAMEEHFRSCQHCTAVLEGTRNVIRLYGDDRMFELPSGFSADAPTYVIEANTATATLRFHAPGNSGSFHIAAFGFQLDERHLARNHHGKLRGTMPRPSAALPISYDPCSVALHICGHFVLLKLAARILL